jgi:hypothetical protein
VFWCIFAYFQTTRNFFSKKIFLNVSSGKKRVLMHFRILPHHQKLFFKKDIFYCLEWLKTYSDAFAHSPRSPETFFQKRYFLMSGVVKNVFWCICAYSQTTRNCFFKKDIFYWLEWLKTCFDAFAHTPRPPETFFQKRYFLLNGVVKNVF